MRGPWSARPTLGEGWPSSCALLPGGGRSKSVRCFSSGDRQRVLPREELVSAAVGRDYEGVGIRLDGAEREGQLPLDSCDDPRRDHGFLDERAVVRHQLCADLELVREVTVVAHAELEPVVRVFVLDDVRLAE